MELFVPHVQKGSPAVHSPDTVTYSVVGWCIACTYVYTVRRCSAIISTYNIYYILYRPPLFDVRLHQVTERTHKRLVVIVGHVSQLSPRQQELWGVYTRSSHTTACDVILYLTKTFMVETLYYFILLCYVKYSTSLLTCDITYAYTSGHTQHRVSWRNSMDSAVQQSTLRDAWRSFNTHLRSVLGALQ